LLGLRWAFDGEQFRLGGDGIHGGSELAIEKVDFIVKALFKASHKAIADLLHLLRGDVPRDLGKVILDGIAPSAEEIVSLLTD
jgi:hypothetical protein